MGGFFYSRLKHNVMVFGILFFFFVLFCFFGGYYMYSILRLILSCEKRREYHRRCFCRDIILIVNVSPLLVCL